MITTLRVALVAVSLLGFLGCGDNVLVDSNPLGYPTGGAGNAGGSTAASGASAQIGGTALDSGSGGANTGGSPDIVPATGGTAATSTGGAAAVSAGGAGMAQAGNASNPLAALPTCTSMSTWNGSEGERMRPGEACIACHEDEGEGPELAIAGTVYPTGHEPDDCNGVGTSPRVVVIVTGADGTEHRMSVNSAGNFTFEDRIALPYTAKVTSPAGERIMATPQIDGDCNGCHTQNGANGAPGRVVAP